MLYLALPSLPACEGHGRNTTLRALPKYFLEAPEVSSPGMVPYTHPSPRELTDGG